MYERALQSELAQTSPGPTSSLVLLVEPLFFLFSPYLSKVTTTCLSLSEGSSE